MKSSIYFCAALLALCSCGTTTQVFTDHDKSVSMTSYSTYKWVDLKDIAAKNNDARYYNGLTDQRIKNAVDHELGGKGYRKDTVGPQLMLHYHIIVEDKSAVTDEPAGILYGVFRESRVISEYKYREGTLIIDMTDVKTHQLVWRGSAKDVITEKTVQKPEEAINNAVHAIFKKFP